MVELLVSFGESSRMGCLPNDLLMKVPLVGVLQLCALLFGCIVMTISGQGLEQPQHWKKSLMSFIILYQQDQKKVRLDEAKVYCLMVDDFLYVLTGIRDIIKQSQKWTFLSSTLFFIFPQSYGLNSLYILHNLFLTLNMQSQKSQKKLVKKTVIPIKIQDNPKQLRGIVRFSTESAKTQIIPAACSTERKKNIVVYKNQNTNKQEEEEQQKRKKEIDLYEVTIAPSRFKNKQFKVEIPITRGPKSIKASKANDLYYTFHFSNSQGRITLLNGQYQAKMEFIGKDKKESTYNQRLQMQLSKLDNRKKQGLGDMKTFQRSDSEN